MAPVKRAGFTLLEILIVIVIVGILSALLLIGVHAALVSSKESSTESMIKSITGALEGYRAVYGDYPPSSLDRFRAKLPNDTNNGIESLVACLSTKKSGGPFYKPPDEGLYSNLDGDKADVNITQWYFGDNQLRELIDFFGQSLYYIHHSDFDKPKPNQIRMVISRGEKPVEVKPQKSASTNTWANHGKYQLLGPGRDGKFGTEDDVKGY
jgi:prepilin-type N-terminal cleavage/methylation domain-containing protein